MKGVEGDDAGKVNGGGIYRGDGGGRAPGVEGGGIGREDGGKGNEV